MGQQVEQQITPQYECLHIEKRKLVSFGLERHIERGHTEISEEIISKDSIKLLIKSLVEEKFCPDNADEERSSLNVELIPRPTVKVKSGKEVKEVPMKISQVIKKRVKEAIGTDQVDSSKNMALEVLLSGSPKTMCAMSEETLASWCRDSVQWCKDTFGEENVVSATLHRDEKTPHIHVFVVPIASGVSKSAQKKREQRKKMCEETGQEYHEYKVKEKLRLSADDFMGSKAFSGYHDSYSHVTIKYGLQRGLKAEKGSKKRHQTSEDYNRELARKAEEQEKQIEKQSKEITRLKSDLEIAKVELNLTQGKNQELQADNKFKEKENDILRKLNGEQEKKYNDLENKYNELENKYKDKLENLNYQIITKENIETIPEITMGVLRKIVKEDMKCRLVGYGKMDNGDYYLDIVSFHGSTNRYKVDSKTGDVFSIGSQGQGWYHLPEANGKRFLAFFQTFKNEAFYNQLAKRMENAVNIRAGVKGSQAPAAAAPSQVHAGHGGGHRSDEPKRFANISFGHGGGKDTPGASSSEKGESVYDEAVRKGEEERQKRRGPDF